VDHTGAARATNYIFVSGGVVSSVGKGITVASIGRLLKARGISVCILKLDPYINVDPGTMSPYQHGEVFVTDDGAETDLDLGHYERFIDENLTRLSNVTTGQIVLFGLTGGLMPCPAAFSILVICLQVKHVTLGFALVLAFSMGLALTLVATGSIAAWTWT